MTHGGDVERVSREFRIPAETILDFSANVNPLGLPARAMESLARAARDGRLLMQYPDPEASVLRSALSQRLEIPVESIVVGAGADSLIHAALRAIAPQRCILPVPAFSEYARACRAFGCAIHPIKLTADEGFALPEGALRASRPGDLVILNNPHNPTGRCATRSEMLDRIAAIRSSGAAVLADEAFIDYVPDAAITREAAAASGVIAIRSLTKFFGCPGLRVGYAVAAPETAHTIAAQFSAWPVTTLALHALAEALDDIEYLRATLERNRRARARLADALERLGCRVFPPSANFIFFQIPNGFHASEVRDTLIRERAILVRECDSFEGLEPGRYLRIAVRSECENDRLTEGLTAIFGQPSCQHQT
jgi:threonine-phosphate decarboxylase